MSARRLFAAGVFPMTVDTVCFTHMHSDHITDVPDFLIMRWAGGAQKPLTVYGPEGTQRMIDGFLAAMADDIRFRFAHHGDKLSQEGIKTIVHEVPATPDRARSRRGWRPHDRLVRGRPLSRRSCARIPPRWSRRFAL